LYVQNHLEQETSTMMVALVCISFQLMCIAWTLYGIRDILKGKIK
jgi:hypothetical protein